MDLRKDWRIKKPDKQGRDRPSKHKSCSGSNRIIHSIIDLEPIKRREREERKLRAMHKRSGISERESSIDI